VDDLLFFQSNKDVPNLYACPLLYCKRGQLFLLQVSFNLIGKLDTCVACSILKKSNHIRAYIFEITQGWLGDIYNVENGLMRLGFVGKIIWFMKKER
jgi:hypothetical protein